ncbi:MAG: O-antigen ligase family protein [Alphaproteobacteria bacterium]|jgi:O-antigen ligase|nr:O-antigen ligase family protein [Thalassospira sp.]MCE2965448.1 O-antigen ligase family protein [Alphaproteobacteria bacterium]
MTSRKILDACFWFVVVVTLLAALPLGSARPWAWNTLSLLYALTGLVVAGVLVKNPRVAGNAPPLMPLLFPVSAYLLVLLWAMLQTLPIWPESLAHPLWAQASAALEMPVSGRIAVDPQTATASFVRLLGYLYLFLMVVFMANSRERARQVLHAVVLGTALYAAYGLIVYFSGNETVLWFDKWAYKKDLTATFVNRNSCATFMGMGVLTVAGLLMQHMVKNNRFEYGLRSGMRYMLLALLTPYALWLLSSFTLLLTALLLTNSRAGFVSVGIALIVLALLIVPKKRWSVAAKMALTGVIAAGLLLFLEAQSSKTAGRLLETDLAEEGRPAVFKLTFAAIEGAPLTGHGLGGFLNAFALYRDGTVIGTYDKAHSDYLELAFDLGIPAALLFTAVFVAVLWRVRRGWQARSNQRYVQAIALAVSLQVFLHALVDFSLQIPAVAALFTLLLAAAYARSFPAVRER